MPLFREVEPNVFEQWMGEPINGIPYPFNIEETWDYGQLASIGLYRPQPPEPVPNGYKIISTKPGWATDGYVRYIHELELEEPQPVLKSQVDDEAMRRIEGGFLYNGKTFDSTTVSIRRINGAGTLASIAVMNGAQPGNFYWQYPPNTWELPEETKQANGMTPFGWIVSDNTIMLLDAYMVIEMGAAAAAWERDHVFAARTLKNMNPIPLDYKDEIYWP